MTSERARLERIVRNGCPGIRYEDVCATPDDCAETGCRILRIEEAQKQGDLLRDVLPAAKPKQEALL